MKLINKRNKGNLSFDFLISITVCCLLLIFVILTTMTFSLVATAQYIAYASAREYFIGHDDVDTHNAKAGEEYDSLKSKFFPSASGTPLSKWFCLVGPTIYNGQNIGLGTEERTRFGVGFKFISHVMTMTIPFLGKVGDGTSGDRCPGASGNDGFAFPIAAFLGREVSKAECQGFFTNPNTGFVSGGNGC